MQGEQGQGCGRRRPATPATRAGQLGVHMVFWPLRAVPKCGQTRGKEALSPTRKIAAAIDLNRSKRSRWRLPQALHRLFISTYIDREYATGAREPRTCSGPCARLWQAGQAGRDSWVEVLLLDRSLGFLDAAGTLCVNGKGSCAEVVGRNVRCR